VKQYQVQPEGLEPVGYTLDPEAGVAYFHLTDGRCSVERTVQVTPWLLVDYDAQGRPLGVELLKLDLRAV
jgi:uncharacterized protein YuzE